MKKLSIILAIVGGITSAGLAQAPSTKQPKAVSRIYAPIPPYPYQARAAGAQGTGIITVSFDERGKAVRARMTKSTGSSILDDNSVAFALANWKTPGGKKTTVRAPVTYRLR